MTPLNLRDLVTLNLATAEVHRKNLDTKGDYKPTEAETTKTILMNQQCIMLMLSALLWRNDAQLCDYLENQITYDQEHDRWVIGK